MATAAPLMSLQEPAYDKATWQQFMKAKNPSLTTAYPLVEVTIGVSTGFQKKAPAIIKFLSKYQTSNKIISDALAYMQAEKGRTMEDAAMYFLKTQSQSWQQWVPPVIAKRVKVAAGLSETEDKPWAIDIATPINDFVLNLVRNYQPFFTAIGDPIRQLILWTEACLFFIPFWVFIVVLTIACFFLGGLKLALVSVLGLGLIYALGLWALSVQTLALMIISTLVCIVIGLPTGILLARSYRARSVALPLLDAMQTMPSFVYLIPALMLFGLGKVPALFATVIYAVAPMIKLTDLGIRKVDANVIEASRSFGSSPSQLLFGVQLPLALPTIMAGLNQTIMLALSMVVVASMIGARGLGEQVLLGIQKLDVGQGFTAGLGIVALAIVLDRITQKIGHKLGN